jgi:hypothetical protein
MTRMRTWLGCLCVLLLVVATSGSAWANTAANAEIINRATLSYAGGSKSAVIKVTVNLVPSAPNVGITFSSDQYGSPNLPALTNTVTITATANGPASYTLTPSITGPTNVVGLPTAQPAVTVVAAGSPGSYNFPVIGATVTSGASGTTFLTVPASGATGDNAVVNGIGPGTKVTFSFTTAGVSHGATAIIGSTTEVKDGSGVATGVYRLNFAAIPAADVPPAGTVIGEVKTINVSVTPGTISNVASNITVPVKVDVSIGSLVGSATQSTPDTWTPPNVTVDVNKYVRNIDTGTAGTSVANNITINGTASDYFDTGVTAVPGNHLEYVIVAKNNGATNLNTSAITDMLPTDLVTLVYGAYGGADQDIFYQSTSSGGGGPKVKIGTTAGSQQATFALVTPAPPAKPYNLTINVGNGANSSQPGVIEPGKSVTIAYKVTVN